MPAETDDASSARGWILSIAAVLVAAAVFLLITQAPKKQLPQWNRPVLGYEILTIFCVVIIALPALELIRIALHKTRRKMMRGLKRFVLCIISVSVCIVAFDIICATYPALQQSFVGRDILTLDRNCEDPKYGYRGAANARDHFIYDPAYGDLLPSGLQSRTPAPDEKKVACTNRNDRNGFPNSDVPEHADFIIVGDSFAYETLFAEGKHWVTAIRDNVQGGVYDLAVPGWGPQCESLALLEYGLPLKPKVVIWAFCEGNDLPDAEAYLEFKLLKEGSGISWNNFVALGQGLPPQEFPYNRPFARLLMYVAQRLNPPPKGPRPPGANLDPVIVTLGQPPRSIALELGIFYQMLMNKEQQLKPWRGWQITEHAIRQAIEACKEQDIKFVLVYFPSKGNVYLPLIEKQLDHAEFYNSILPCLPDSWRNGPDHYFDVLHHNMSNVPDLLRTLCDKDVLFIDTTPSLRKAVNDGLFPYWSFDTHLNPDGHGIVAKAILEELRKANLLPAASPASAPPTSPPSSSASAPALLHGRKILDKRRPLRLN